MKNILVAKQIKTDVCSLELKTTLKLCLKKQQMENIENPSNTQDPFEGVLSIRWVLNIFLFSLYIMGNHGGVHYTDLLM